MKNQVLDQRGGSIKSLNSNQRFFQIKKNLLGNLRPKFFLDNIGLDIWNSIHYETKLNAKFG